MAQKTWLVYAAKCKQCRDSFYRTHRAHRFCCAECKKKHKANFFKKYRIKKKKELSRDKDANKIGTVKRVCRHCQKVFYTFASQVRHRGGLYCSTKCSYRARTFDSLRVDTLDKWWKKAVIKKKGAMCEYCGTSEKLSAHHIFSRTNKKMRWDVENSVVLCYKHHVAGEFSAHKSPTEFVEWLKKTKPKKWYDNLRLEAKTIGDKIDRREKVKELFLILDKQN